MKIYYFVSICILFISCNSKKPSSNKNQDQGTVQKIAVPEFQTIIDSADVEGSILIYNLEDHIFYSNDFEWAKKGYLPASTFKITNSIIALETGAVKSDSSLFKWNGEKRRIKSWEQDFLFKEAFQYSCVPCYQEVARRIGVTKMNEYLKKLNYGNMKVDSNNIDMFWLVGESRINQFQQIDFLKRMYQSELPISERTELIVKRMMVVDDNKNYKLSGKTGWSVRNGNNNGWYVGYIETQKHTYIFATNVEPKQEFNMDMFPMIRKDITLKAFKKIKIIK